MSSSRSHACASSDGGGEIRGGRMSGKTSGDASNAVMLQDGAEDAVGAIVRCGLGTVGCGSGEGGDCEGGGLFCYRVSGTAYIAGAP